MTKSRILLSALLGACSAGLALYAPAFAGEDGKFYNAGFCHESGRATGEYFRDEGQISKVAGTGYGRVICPVIRENFRDGTVGMAHVFVTDFVNGPDSRSTSVTCAFSLRKRNGDPTYWRTAASTGASTEVQELFMNPGIGTTSDAGAWSVECTLPTSISPWYARIHGYAIYEYDRSL